MSDRDPVKLLSKSKIVFLAARRATKNTQDLNVVRASHEQHSDLGLKQKVGNLLILEGVGDALYKTFKGPLLFQ